MSELNPRKLDVLARIKRHPELQPFFFKKVRGLKWLNGLYKCGFFDPNLNPMPVESEDEGYWRVPSWPVLDYLVGTAPELEDVEYINKYLNIIRSVTRKAMELDTGNYRTWWQFAKIVRHIPVKYITSQDVELLAYWLRDKFDRMIIADELSKGLLNNLLVADVENSKELLLKLLEALTQFKFVDKKKALGNGKEPLLVVDEGHARKIFKKVASHIGKVVGQDGVEVFRGKIEEILAELDNDHYSSIWRPAVEEHPQNVRTKDPLDIFISAFRDSIDGYVASHSNGAADYVRSLLDSEYKVIQRVVIYVTSQRFDDLKAVSEHFLTSDFFNYHFQHELHHFLRMNFSSLGSEGRKQVVDIIDGLAVDSDAEGKLKEKQVAHKKLTWLYAIKGQGDEYADILYEKNLRMTGSEPEHPDFSSYMESGWVGDKTPHSKEELLSRDIDDLVKLLNSFQEEPGWKTPTRRGLAKELKQAVKASPEYFDANLAKFVSGDFAYSFELIEAYRELWTEQKYCVNWSWLFDFCLSLIKREDFWSDELNKPKDAFVANRSWIVGAIGELITAGTRSDKNALDIRFMPKAKEILDVVLSKQEGEEFQIDSDAVFVAINSPRGKCIEALLNYALRGARVADKEKGGHEQFWGSLQPNFEKELARAKEGVYEFGTLVVNHLPNFLYLSKEWTLDNLESIFSKSDRLHWLCAMRGYAYVDKVYKEIYDFLCDEGHFWEALNAGELKEKTRAKVIQNILVAYLSWEEPLDDPASSIRIFLERGKIEEYREAIWFLSGFRKGSNGELKKKIMDLWFHLGSKANTESREGRSLYSALCTWSRFIDDLSGEQKDLLYRAAPFAEVEHHAYMVIEALKELVDTYPKETGEIYLRMLEGCSPTYEIEDIKYILKKLWLSGGAGKETVKKICDKYIEHEVAFCFEYLRQLKGYGVKA